MVRTPAKPASLRSSEIEKRIMVKFNICSFILIVILLVFTACHQDSNHNKGLIEEVNPLIGSGGNGRVIPVAV